MPDHKHTVTDHIRLLSLPLLLFLCGMVHVKLYVKLAAVVCYAGYLLYRQQRFPRKLAAPGLFYLLAIPLGALSALCNDVGGNPDYWRGFAIATMKWMTAGAGFYLLGMAVQRVEKLRLVATIKAFFLVNALVSLGELVSVMIRSHRWIPYWINDSTTFGISTGDYIHGLTRDSSIANASLNLAGILFFLFRKNPVWVLLCLIIMVMCTSNFSMILLFVCLAAVVILVRDRRVKVYAVGCAVSAVLLYGFLSMQNVLYANKTINNEIEGISSGRRSRLHAMQQHVLLDGGKGRDAEAMPTGSVDQVIADLRQISIQVRENDPPKLDTGLAREAIWNWYGVSYDSSRLGISGIPGKLYALLQTGSYMISSPGRLLLGAGPGNFSSNLAIKMTGAGIHGSYPPDQIYVHHDFLEHHLYIWMYVYAHTREFQSVTQMPASVYSQLGGEYGIIGLGLFFILYIGYFLKRYRFGRMPLILTGMLMGYFFVDYWFEMISLTVLFELFMLADLFPRYNPRKIR